MGKSLAALQKYAILDTGPEQAFDDCRRKNVTALNG